MSRRKRIGLFVAYPELTHVRRIIEGVSSQCKKYDYDLLVFASNVHFSFPHPKYVQGEGNIFGLANPDELDGVILDVMTMMGDEGDKVLNQFLKKLSKYKDIPKCSLDMPAKGIHLIADNNEEILRESCRHVIEVHGRKKICILTGQKDNVIAESRLSIYLDEIRKHGLDVLPEHIVYGDFYYTSGDDLANRIARGEIERPDAVICASDCMAMGLIDRLDKIDIKVPEDIVVVGFDCSDEGAINPVTVASYEPSDKEVGARAVDYMRTMLDPGEQIIPFERAITTRFHAGASCGCHVDPVYSMKRFRDYMYISSYNPVDEDPNAAVGLGPFMEGYVLEGFTAAESPDACLKKIHDNAHMLKPYKNFYLCLKENWKDISDGIYDGYPDKMKVYVAASGEGKEGLYSERGAVAFSIDKMLPALYEENEEASIYYFSPVHFDGDTLGYAVLQRKLVDHPVINVVYRSWIRFINNALEMTRSKEQLQAFSVRDMMTGLYNRRGMYKMVNSMLDNAKDGDSLFVAVADMDGLKYVNDTFGHAEGDYGIKTVSTALNSIAGPDEICVRSGGDEFFLIGVGKYTDEDEAGRAHQFADALAKMSADAGKPYNISASIGCVVFDKCKDISLDAALAEADERMYRYKVRNRRHRMV